MMTRHVMEGSEVSSVVDTVRATSSMGDWSSPGSVSSLREASGGYSSARDAAFSIAVAMAGLACTVAPEV